MPLGTPDGLYEGVDGRLLGLCARLSSSARRSCSDLEVGAFLLDALEMVDLADLDAGPSVPRSSNWARSSSSVGADFPFLDAIVLYE